MRPRLNSRIITGKGQRTHSRLECARYPRIRWHKSRKESGGERGQIRRSLSSLPERHLTESDMYAGFHSRSRSQSSSSVFFFFFRSSPSSVHDLSPDDNYGTVATLLRPSHKVECTITWPPLAGVLRGVHVPRCTVSTFVSRGNKRSRIICAVQFGRLSTTLLVPFRLLASPLTHHLPSL